ncbi:MAG: carboxylating nicotinate-nucleotide diphosphorylase [Nitrososphaeraceae archaeon]
MKKLYDYIELRQKLNLFLQEDIGYGDITSNNLRYKDRDKVTSALVTYKSNISGVLSGIEEASLVFEICNCNIILYKKDGDKIIKNDVIMKITGKVKYILKAERTALNILMRMSGISTITRTFVELAQKIDKSVSVASTRKTVPGLRLLDKKAVVVGGGISHRLRLDDMVLIKDNHLAVSNSISNTITIIRKKIGNSIKIECEVTNEKDAIEAIEAGADIVMLDNFSHVNAKKTINKIKKLGLRDKVKIEISGSITIQNFSNYVKCKPDIISIGYITHSSRSLDFSLKIPKN